MKRSWHVMILMVLVTGLMLIPATAWGKSSITNKGDFMGKTVKFKADMNGDGVNETIAIKGTKKDEMSMSKVTIKVTDSKGRITTTTLKSSAFSETAFTKARLVVLTNKRKFLELYVGGFNDYVSYDKLFKYNASKGTFTSVASLAKKGTGWCDLRKATETGILVRYGAQPSTIGALTFKHTYNYTSGKFVLAKKTVAVRSSLGNVDYPGDGLEKHFAKNEYKTARKLTFYKTYNGSVKAFTVPKNKYIKLTKVRLYNGNIYGRFSYDGSYGWKKLSVMVDYDYSSDHPENTGWFYGVYNRLAG